QPPARSAEGRAQADGPQPRDPPDLHRSLQRTCSFCTPSGTTEIAVKSSRDSRWLRRLRAGSVGAAFGDQKIAYTVHDFVVGAADRGGPLPFLADETDGQETLEMMGKCRASEFEL